MTFLFPPQKQIYPIHTHSTEGQYLRPFLSLPVSKDVTQHQRDGEAFWTPVYTFSFRRNKLG